MLILSVSATVEIRRWGSEKGAGNKDNFIELGGAARNVGVKSFRKFGDEKPSYGFCFVLGTLIVETDYIFTPHKIYL